MRWIDRIAGLVLPACLVAGCTTALPPDKVEAIGPPFNEEVKKGYVQLAAYDGRFHDKARAAMLGDEVWPDKVGNRDIPPELRPEALALRSRLVAALEGNARVNAPVDAAAAQTNFDCWLNELEEGPTSAEAAACREGFLVALAAAEAAAVGASLPSAFEVFFESGRADLDRADLSTIEEAARGIAESRAGRVEVIGYADRSGDPAMNERLARRRAESVAAALAQSGVPRDRIETRSGGTIGSLNDRQSRRVDIVVDG